MALPLFEDLFTIREVDPDGKKFDKVSRFKCHGEQFEADLILDVNVDIYPMKVNQKFSLALATTLANDGAADEGIYDQSNKPSLMDKYEYVMYGKVYKVVEDKGAGSSRIEVLASFGGLLMSLKGDQSSLAQLDVDKRLYLLMRLVPGA